MDVDELSVQDNSALYALSFGVCALAVAGAVMRTPTVRANRTMVPFRTGGWNRTAAPVMHYVGGAGHYQPPQPTPF